MIMAKGVKTGGGSRKGVPNRITKELKEMILGALDDAGGQNYLAQQAKENPSAFMTLLGKTLPRDVNAKLTGKNDGPIEFDVKSKAARLAGLLAIAKNKSDVE